MNTLDNRLAAVQDIIRYGTDSVATDAAVATVQEARDALSNVAVVEIDGIEYVGVLPTH